MIVFFPPEKRTRFPFLLGRRPSPASMTPALTSSSLNLPMSLNSFSEGSIPASEFFVAFTITMTRIVGLLSVPQAGSAGMTSTARFHEGDEADPPESTFDRHYFFCRSARAQRAEIQRP